MSGRQVLDGSEGFQFNFSRRDTESAPDAHDLTFCLFSLRSSRAEAFSPPLLTTFLKDDEIFSRENALPSSPATNVEGSDWTRFKKSHETTTPTHPLY